MRRFIEAVSPSNQLPEWNESDSLYGSLEDSLREYLHGSCWAFALGVARVMGWTLGWMRDGTGHPVHGYAVTPQGKLVDASGYVTAKQIAKRYGIANPVFEACTEAQMREIVDVDFYEMREAVRFAAYLNKPPFPIHVAYDWPEDDD